MGSITLESYLSNEILKILSHGDSFEKFSLFFTKVIVVVGLDRMSYDGSVVNAY